MDNYYNDIHRISLNIFKEFDRICQKYDLKYFAIGGTCLGAIRHQGFIPWDDDMDFAMPFVDYLRFRKIAIKELREPYKIIDYKDIKQYKDFWLKIHDSNTTFIEKEIKDKKELYRGVSIDIMPICAITKKTIPQKIFLLKMYIFTKLDYNNRSNMNDKKSLLKKILWLCLMPLYKKDFNYYSNLLEKMCRKYSFNEKNDICFAWRFPLRKTYSNVFKYNDFSKSIEKKFEDVIMKVPINYDDYLKNDYGDYMTPPENERINHDPYLCDLKKSYLSYLEEKE